MPVAAAGAVRIFTRVAALAMVMATGARAQESAIVEVLAPVLAAEDARAWRPAALQAALAYPDSLVRRTGAMAVGRIGDPRGVELLVPLLSDPDTTVRVSAVFALGLLRDTSAIGPLIDRLRAEPVLDAASAAEAVTALAKIGGPRAAEVISGILQGRALLGVATPDALVPVAALEAWRLGPDAPVAELLPLARAESDDVRWRAVFSLSRLRPSGSASRLGEALSDPLTLVRSFAVRAFTRSFADSSGIGAEGAAALVLRLLDDDDPGVRIGALRALASLEAARFAARVVPMLDDAHLNVRVQAAATLGALGGPEAGAALERAAGSSLFALQREALLGLARADTAAFRRAAATWARSARWEERAVVAEASGSLGGRPALLDDPDGRVVAAALAAWGEQNESAARDAARGLLEHRDLAVRAVAVELVGRAADVADIGLFRQAYLRARSDTAPDAAIAALTALAGIARRSEAAAAAVTREFLERAPAPASYVLRQWAESGWPAAARRWGSPWPITTGRTLQDYRELIRRYIVASDSLRRPHVRLETELGSIEVELLGPEAPVTVANFLALVDRGAFDGSRFHRVVPNFVIQDGDPRGDGWGAAGPPIRDEINRERYLTGVMGMALSGPDTGTSQWFITLSPQPHLDGGYTVFGRVVGPLTTLMRITQGDVIRTVRR